MQNNTGIPTIIRHSALQQHNAISRLFDSNRPTVAQLVQAEALRYETESAGSSPDEEFETFHSLNPSGRTMTLWWIQPLAEMSTRDHSLGGGCVNKAGV
jgi:hypothetical protein